MIKIRSLTKPIVFIFLCLLFFGEVLKSDDSLFYVTIEAAKEYILEQFDVLVEDTTNDETGQVMVEEEGWYENFILDKYEIRKMEVTLN